MSNEETQTAERLRRIRTDYVTNAGRSRRDAERYAERGSANWSRWSEKEASEFEADAAALLAGAAAIDAYRWRPVAELTEGEGEIVWGRIDHQGLQETSTEWSHRGAIDLGYTHFLRLPKLEGK